MSSGVEFEEDGFGFKNRPAPSSGDRPAINMTYSNNLSVGNQPKSGSGMTAWLIKKGIVKSNTAAQAILIGIFVINMIITFVLIAFFT